MAVCYCPANHPEPPKGIVEDLESSGVTVLRIPPPLVSPLYPLRLCRMIGQLRPDILHLQGATVGVVGAVVGRVVRVPRVIYTEQNQYDVYARWLRTALERTAGLLNWRVCVSKSSQQSVLRVPRLNRWAARTSVIHNAVDLRSFGRELAVEERESRRAALGIAPGHLAIGSVGLLAERKGYEYLIRALAALLPDVPSIRLVLIGGGEQEQYLRTLADELGLTPYVHFLGWRGDVPDLLSVLDLYVQPSLTEGLPHTVVEAAASGLPIVATRVGGIPEVIQDGISGVLVDPRDATGLASGITRLLADPATRQALGSAARLWCLEHFSADAMARRYEALYLSLLCQTPARH